METVLLLHPIVAAVSSVLVTFTRSRVWRLLVNDQMQTAMMPVTRGVGLAWIGTFVSTILYFSGSGWIWVGTLICLTGVGAVFNGVRLFSSQYKAKEVSSMAWLTQVWVAWSSLSILLITHMIMAWIS